MQVMRKFGIIGLLLAPLMLSAATRVLVDDDFNDLTRWQLKCEKETCIMLSAGTAVLGGKGSTGEKAAMAYAVNPAFSSWVMLAEKLSWSHNAALGGHPTDFSFCDAATGNGYRVEILNAVVTIYRLDHGAPVKLSSTVPLWNSGTDYTRPRTLTIARTQNGKITAGFDGIVTSAVAEDKTYGRFNELTIGYRVFCHGYGAMLDSIFLKESDLPGMSVVRSSAMNVNVVSGLKIGILDSEMMEHPLRRSGWPQEAATLWRQVGYVPQIIPAGTLMALAAKFDVVVIKGGKIAQDDLAAAEAVLRHGKSLWLLNANAGYTLMVPDAKQPDHWLVADNREKSLAWQLNHHFMERIMGGPLLAHSPASMSRDGRLFVTPAGRKALGLGSDVIREDSCALIPLNDSICRQMLPPWVETTVWLTGNYRGRNWIFQQDEFTAAVAWLEQHHAGEFAGAKVVITGFSGNGGSWLSPARPQFLSVSSRILNELAVPATVKSWPLPEMSVSPLLTRSNFFTYPGYVAGPLCFNNGDYVDNRFLPKIWTGPDLTCASIR